MPAWERLLQFLSYGFLIISFLIMLSFSRWEMLQTLIEKRMQHVQVERKQLLKDRCGSDKTQYFKEFRKEGRLDHLLLDDAHGLIYCSIPKVASSNLKRLMLVLKNGEPYADPGTITGYVHDKLIPLSSLPRTEAEAKLKHYTKFLFVRDPFVRLISGYRDKFRKLNEPFYNFFGRDILHLYGKHPNPPRTMAEALASGMHISFHNFIQYLLDPQTEKSVPFEPHWRQMYRLCQPCLIQYDFIGHQETLQEDIEHLLKILKLPDELRIPSSYINMTASDSVDDWFRTVPLEDRRKLYTLYERDFKLFGYRKPEELLQGSHLLNSTI